MTETRKRTRSTPEIARAARWIVSDGKGYVLCIGYWAIVQERRGRRDYGGGQSCIY